MTIIDNKTANKTTEPSLPEAPTTVAGSAAATDGNENESKADSSKEKDVANKASPSVKPTTAKFIALVRSDLPLVFLALLSMIISEAGNLAVPKIVGMAWDALQAYFYVLGAESTTTATDGDSMDPSGDDSLERATMKEINFWMAISIGAYIISLIFGFLRGWILGVVGERLVARLRTRVYGSVLQQEIGFFDEHKTGEIVSRIGSDTQLLQSTISTFLPETLIGFVKSSLAMALSFTINAKLTGVALAGVLSLTALAIPFGKKYAVLSKKYQDILGDAQTRSTEALGSIRTVQSFASEPKELNRYTEKIGDPDNADSNKETTYAVGSNKALVANCLGVIVFGGAFGFLYCTVWYGLYLVTVDGTLTLGGLSAFQSYVFIIGAGIGQLVNNLTQAIGGIAASGRVFYLLERNPQIKNYDGIHDDDDEEEEEKDDAKGPNSAPASKTNKAAKEPRKSIVPTSQMEGNISFENIMFSYPTRKDVLVLNDFTLKFAKNTTTALVGSSGSGKSTVVGLIQRFYDVDGGKLTLDGTDITHLDMSWLRSRIGYVQQEPQLFGVPIRENLTYGLSEEQAATVTQIELENVCRDANAHDFISSWPEGYDTMVGERGITLSGGQKQRVAIARALLTNCRILLLDEATSALDAESEHEVQKAIENAMVGRTVVVVAHRLSTIQSADQIVVMDNGKIAGIGTHEELLTGCTRYQELIKRQHSLGRNVSSATLEKLLPGTSE